MTYDQKVEAIRNKLAEIKIVPVLAVSDAKLAPMLGKTLSENGLPCAEVTFRTAAAVDVMKEIRKACPEMVLGAGTVLSTEQVDMAIEAGCDFAVSPGFNPEVVKYAMEKGLPFIPGVNNPSHVEQAMSIGLKVLKFFPAGPSGGVGMLKALNAVYPVDFMPTGGVNVDNAMDYLGLSKVFCCGGTWMVPADLVDGEKWDEIAQLTKDAAALIQ